MAAGLALAGAGMALSTLGSFFGGGNNYEKLPQWLIDLIRSEFEADRTTSYMPRAATFEKRTQAAIDEVMGQMGANREGFLAEATSRGVGAGRAALSNLYRTVTAPAVRAGATVATQSQLQYEQLRGNVAMAEQSRKAQMLQLLIQAVSGRIPTNQTGFQNFASGLGNLGEFGTQAGILKLLGFFDAAP
jgi:hypothetical protein